MNKKIFYTFFALVILAGFSSCSAEGKINALHEEYGEGNHKD